MKQTPAESEESSQEAPRNLLLPDVARWTTADGPMISLAGVTKSFGEDHILRGLDLDIEVGGITAVMGVSGSGKTVLVKVINGLMPFDEGNVTAFGKDVAALSSLELGDLRRRLATMFQNYALFDSMTVLENVCFPLIQNAAATQKQAEEYAVELLEDLGLGEAIKRYPSEISGGMKKRVSFARTIITRPEAVLFDDPTTGLDPVMMRFVDEMILDMTEKMGLTSILVSHNLPSVFRLAHRIAILHEGEIVAYGTPQEIRAETKTAVHALVSRIDRQEIEGDQTIDDEAADAELIVEMADVYKSFGDNHVLKGINFRVPKNSITIVIGGSGSGKSVMMKHILGLMIADRGKVELFGQEVSELTEKQLRELRSQIGMLFQGAALFDSMSVLDNVAFPLVERGGTRRKDAYEKAEEILTRLKLESSMHSMPPDISTGQKKRAALARALITRPKMMVYDEPTTGQDPIMSDYVEEMILEVHESFDLTSVIISHDMASTIRMADEVAMLYKGEILVQDTPAKILENPDERVREFIYATQLG